MLPSQEAVERCADGRIWRKGKEESALAKWGRQHFSDTQTPTKFVRSYLHLMWPTTALFQNLTSQPFKRAQLGLFQGKTRLSGNNVPFSKHKTRRTWLPNVQRKRLFSDTLGQNVSVKLTTRALRTIKKHGGIDNYVQKTRSELLGWEGMKLRTRIKDKKELDALEASEYTPEEARQILESITATPPSLALAAAERERVQLALGLESLPSAAQTIAFLEKERTDLEKALQ